MGLEKLGRIELGPPETVITQSLNTLRGVATGMTQAPLGILSRNLLENLLSEWGTIYPLSVGTGAPYLSLQVGVLGSFWLAIGVREQRASEPDWSNCTGSWKSYLVFIIFGFPILNRKISKRNRFSVRFGSLFFRMKLLLLFSIHTLDIRIALKYSNN